MKIQNLEIDGIDTTDYPDFCDAYASYAEWEDVTCNQCSAREHKGCDEVMEIEGEDNE